MPAFSELESQLPAQPQQRHQTINRICLESLKALAEKTGRNTIAYYSCWLMRNVPGHDINDFDIDGFMNVVHNMKREKGLDLILHTPGGGIAATEQIVHYLRSLFGTNIRCIVPQLAMSAGTMIACAAKEIIMGRQSCLGPIDPQLFGLPCHGVVEEFNTAKREVAEKPEYLGVWQPIINKYGPAFLGECQKSMDLSELLVRDWLETGMLAGNKKKAKAVVKALSSHADTKTHDRHLSADRVREIGLVVSMMEDDNDLQDMILTVHHAFMLALLNSNIVKIMESDAGKMFVINGAPPQQVIPMGMHYVGLAPAKIRPSGN